MDKKGRIEEHSKIKLQLYRAYLERYLNVLSVANFFNTLHVYDIFAGKGKSDDGEEGSALLAAKSIADLRKQYPNKPISLKLNEKNKKSLASLVEALKPYKSFTEITEQDADEFISAWKPHYKGHNLFFIDPHGYTQISANNFKKLFSTQHCDCLIFIPVYHIYRFLKPSAEDAKELELDFFQELGIETVPVRDKEKYYTPIADFLLALGIEKESAAQCANVEEFFSLIVDALKKLSGSEFVYSQMIKKHGYNSKYGLFFISHNILGAEKFLEAQKELKKSTAQQMALFDFTSSPIEGSISSVLQAERRYSNTDLYVAGIKQGILPSEMLELLRDAEKSLPPKIEISAVSGKVRNRGGFYISYKHYRDKDNRIRVKIIK